MQIRDEQLPHSSGVDPSDRPAEQTRELLEEHVPLTLIMDLVAPDGPHSQEILDAEGAPEQSWWQQS